MQYSSLDGKDLRSQYGMEDSPDEPVEYNNLYQRFTNAGCSREARDYVGNTPIFAYVATIRSYHEDIAVPVAPDPKDLRKMFAEHDIHAVNNDGDTLLHIVARRENNYASPGDGLDIFKILVELGLDPRKENKSQVTPLDVAAACGNEDILTLFARDE